MKERSKGTGWLRRSDAMESKVKCYYHLSQTSFKNHTVQVVLHIFHVNVKLAKKH
jgi:hypothetical protein